MMRHPTGNYLMDRERVAIWRNRGPSPSLIGISSLANEPSRRALAKVGLSHERDVTYHSGAVALYRFSPQAAADQFMQPIPLRWPDRDAGRQLYSMLLPPEEKQAHVARLTVREIKHACPNVEPARPQFIVPSSIELCRLTSQRLRPIVIRWIVDCT